MKPIVVLVAGARPNYPKVSPLYRALADEGLDVRLVDTGQHYDPELAQEMREDLNLPEPDLILGVGSDSHASQTARVMTAFGSVLAHWRPACVVVVGDVNSTLACALVTVKAWDEDGQRPLLAHVEAGLRSFDRTMPEEINRIVTDSVADLLFTTEPMAQAHLARENIDDGRVHFVGNVMIDSLLAYTSRTPMVMDGRHIVATLHRPSTVDDLVVLNDVLAAMSMAALWFQMPVLLVCHPRTRRQIEKLKQTGFRSIDGIELLPALRYRKFIDLVRSARLAMTDSGGLQEETTVLGVPCLTLRETTERPVTVSHGTNRVVGVQYDAILAALRHELECRTPRQEPPCLWDGHAAVRIAKIVREAIDRH